MASRAATAAPARMPEKAVRAQLARLLESRTFSQVDRLKRFLSFIVGEAVEGRAAELKEYVIGVQVFGKESAFDPRTDPIVRVQARRLRARPEPRERQPGVAVPDALLREGRAIGRRRRPAARRLEWWDSWSIPLIVGGGVYILGGLFTLLVDPTRPLATTRRL